MMFRACIFASSSSDEVLARFKRKSSVWLRRTGWLLSGSALRMAMMVGGIPADLLKIVLWFSFVILSKAYSSIALGSS